MDIGDLEQKKLGDLRDLAREMGVAGFSTMKKLDLVYEIMRKDAEKSGYDFRGGILEVVDDDKQNMGFLRTTKNFLPGPNDIYVSNSQIRRLGLRTGDMVIGQVRVPKDNEKYYSLLRVEAVNGMSAEAAKKRTRYESLTPIFPDEKYKLEITECSINTLVGPGCSYWAWAAWSDCFSAKSR